MLNVIARMLLQVRECPHVLRDDPSGLALYLAMLDYVHDLGALPSPASELQVGDEGVVLVSLGPCFQFA